MPYPTASSTMDRRLDGEPLVGAGAHRWMAEEGATDALVGLGALGDAPIMTRMVVLPMLMTTASLADVAAAAATSSLRIGRALATRGFGLLRGR